MDDLAEIEQAGRDAFTSGVVANACPFTFINSPCWERKDYNRFEREYRIKMDAWMKGWINARKAKHSDGDKHA